MKRQAGPVSRQALGVLEGRGGRPVARFRSLLYAPGDRPDLIERATESVADALILDLEDRVPADRKAQARRIVGDAVADLGRTRIVHVRVNPLDTGLTRADLDAIAGPGLAGIRVPKVETVEAVRELDELLSRIEADRGLPEGSVGLSLGLESARAVGLTYELCSASPRVTSVAPGLGRGGDLQADVGFLPSDDGLETLYIRSKVVLDARRAGVPIPLDGGYGTYAAYDPATEGVAFRRSAESGRGLGYRAKICFHPEQAATINEIFAWQTEDAVR